MKSHAWRTVANSAPHLIPHLTADRSLLDVGCGPGTITIDLARRVAPAPVVGFDVSAAVIERAELMNSNAANALLKTLEEPPPDTYLLLTTSQPGRLLATIVSRCQSVVLKGDAAAAEFSVFEIGVHQRRQTARRRLERRPESSRLGRRRAA